MSDHLARAISRKTASPLTIGSVTSTSPVEVDIAGQTDLCADYLDSYSPLIGDIVLIFQDEESGLVILGKVAAGG